MCSSSQINLFRCESEPLQHLISKRNCEVTINLSMIYRICFSTIDAVSVFLDLESEKLLFSYKNPMNYLEMKFSQFVFFSLRGFTN